MAILPLVASTATAGLPPHAAQTPSSTTGTPATASEIETGIASMRTSCELQIELLEVMTDAVALAVIQSQDVTALTTATTAAAKTVAVSDVLVDALIAMALDGVGVLIQKEVQQFAQQAATAILSTNLAVSVLPLSASGAAMSADGIAKALASLSRSQEASGRVFALYSRGVRAAVAAGSEKVGSALAALAKSTLQPSKKDTLDVKGTDQPRTAISRAVQSYVAAHRLALRIQCVSLEGFIRAGNLTTEQLETLTGSFVVDQTSDDLDSLRETLSLIYEAVIWAKIYRLDQMTMLNGRLPSGLDPNKGGSITGVPDGITKYWCRRFASLVSISAVGAIGGSQQGDYNQSLSVLRVLIPAAQDLNQAIADLQAPDAGIISIDPP